MRWHSATVSKCLILIVFSVLAPVLCLQAYVHYDRFQVEKTLELRRSLEIARSIGETCEGFVGDVLRQEATICRLMNSMPLPDVMTLRQVLAVGKVEWSSVLQLSWVDSGGRIVASTAAGAEGNHISEPAFGALNKDKDWFVSGLRVSAVDGVPFFVICHALFDASGEFQGAVLGIVETREMVDVLSLDLSDRGAFSIIDRHGNVIYRHSTVAEGTEQLEWLQVGGSAREALESGEATRVIREAGGEDRLFAFVALPSIGWVASADRPMEEIMGPIVRGFLWSVILIVLVGTGGVLIALLISRRVVIPTRLLREYAAAVGRGEWSEIPPVSGPVELVELGAAFNKMAHEIDDRQSALRRARDELEVRVAERTAELAGAYESLKVRILEQNRVEDALRRSVAEFRLVYEHSPVMLCSLDEAGVITSANLKWLQEMGFTREEVVGDQLGAFLVGHGSEDGVRIPCFEKDFERDLPLRLLKKDGTHMDALTDCGVIRGLPGEPFLLLATRDVTAQNRSERKLRETKAMLETIFDGISDPLIMFDPSLRVRILNKASLNYFGLETLEEGVGVSCDDLTRGVCSRCERCPIPCAVVMGEGLTMERKSPFDADRLERVVLYPIGNGTEHSSGGAILHITDITEKKRIEKELARTDRLASLGLLSGGIAHEIRNPLAGASLFVDTLMDEERFQRTEFEMEIFTEIKGNIKRINEIIARVLDFARQTDLTATKLDLNQLVRESLKFWNSRLRNHDVRLDLVLDEGLPPVHGDVVGIQQVLNNLMRNAIESMPEGGTLRVITDHGAFRYKRSRPMAILRVVDSGAGIPLEHQKNIFNPFFTTKTSGNGLGLSISHRIVEGFGGGISFQSVPGHTEFHVELPLAPGT